MALIEARGRPHLRCDKCETIVVWPASLSSREKIAVAAITRKDALDGAKFAEVLGLGAREAKALVLHVTQTQGVCRKCGEKVEGGESICPCGSLNLDW